jgi:hypothetical protein
MEEIMLDMKSSVAFNLDLVIGIKVSFFLDMITETTLVIAIIDV